MIDLSIILKIIYYYYLCTQNYLNIENLNLIVTRPYLLVSTSP